ncbi:MAG: ABC transporter permease [Burkholderiales bacterium]|nr:ABC transporter permease [Anaerolineae bacterium]
MNATSTVSLPANSVWRGRNAATTISLLVTFLALVAFFTWRSPNFFTLINLVNLASTLAIVGIVSIGETMVLITGGVDISVGAAAALTGVVMSILLLEYEVGSIWLCALIGVIAGTLVGVVNGLLLTRFKINALIATLGTFSIARGLAFVFSGGQSNLVNDATFQFIGRGNIGGIPFSLLLMLALYVIFWLVLNHTPFGRNLYAIGGSREASRLSGIRVNRHLLAVYAICGFLAALGGIINVSQLATSAPSSSVGLEFAVIAAVVLGGTTLAGGKGTLIGTLIGVIILRILDNGLTLLNISSFWQDAARGGVLLLAVGFDQLRQRWAARERHTGESL